MKIRPADKVDLQAILDVCESAFPAEEKNTILELVSDLLTIQSMPSCLTLGAEISGTLEGYVTFSPVRLDSQLQLSAYILAPLAVSQDHQKKGIGSKLIQEGIKQLKDKKVDLLFVYGDPQYYGRFGFKEELAKKFIPPHPLQYPFGWQGLILNQCNYSEDKHLIECVDPLNKPELW